MESDGRGDDVRDSAYYIYYTSDWLQMSLDEQTTQEDEKEAEEKKKKKYQTKMAHFLHLMASGNACQATSTMLSPPEVRS